MKSTLLVVAGICVGLVVSFALLAAVEMFSAVVHPFPEDFKGTPEEIIRQVKLYPAWVLAVCVPMWGFIGFFGPWIARKIGGISAAAVVGLLLLAGLVCNLSMLPYPIWFKVACLIVIPIGIAVGGRFFVRQPAPAE